MTITISSKGQLVLPAEYRAMDGVRPGEKFEIERLKAGQYVLIQHRTLDNEGVVDWLLACPVKGWFASIPSESTNL